MKRYILPFDVWDKRLDKIVRMIGKARKEGTKWGGEVSRKEMRRLVISGNHYIDNQVNPENFEAMKFGFVPTSMICPYCKNNTVTIIEETFNFGTCFLFVLIILLIPILIIVAAFSGCKSAHYNHTCRCDYCCCGSGSCDCKCCFDSYHYCQHCGKQIGKRNSCLELCPCIDACC